MPIEHALTKKLGKEYNQLTISQKRQKCYDFALANIAKQKEQFAKFGLFTDYDKIYMTMSKDFESRQYKLFLSMIENLVVTISDNPAKVVVNERTGTVVIGNEVKLLPAAIAHGNLTVSIRTDYNVSQPNPFAPIGSETVVTQTSQIDVTKESGKIIELPANSNLSQLVRALNSIGVTPFDLISILQALKAAGSLQATIEII